MRDTIRRTVLMTAFAIGATPAFAQTAATVPPKSVTQPRLAGTNAVAIQARRDVLFKIILKKPDNLDASFEYASLSIQVGDLEAAISTLERMLIFAPGLPRLQLELGVLYYRIQSFEQSRSYFKAAVSGPNVPPEVRARVDQYLAAIDKAGGDRFSGQVRFGLRYQTNANRSTANSLVTLYPGGGTIGQPFTLNAGSLGSEDGNAYGAGVFHYSMNLPTKGDTFETDLVTYISGQFDRHELNVAFAELTAGPAFNLKRFGIDNAALGIYGIASGVFVDGHFYNSGVGAGSRFVIRPNQATSLLTSVEYRHKEYENSALAPTADLRDGDELRWYGAGTYILTPHLAFGLNAYVQRTWADRDYLAYTESGFSLGPRFAFASPISKDMPGWTAALNVGAVYRDYQANDPIFSPTEAENDQEVFVGGNLVMPMKNNFALITDAEYRHSESNYSIRNWDNFSVSLSLAKSF